MREPRIQRAGVLLLGAVLLVALVFALVGAMNEARALGHGSCDVASEPCTESAEHELTVSRQARGDDTWRAVGADLDSFRLSAGEADHARIRPGDRATLTTYGDRVLEVRSSEGQVRVAHTGVRRVVMLALSVLAVVVVSVSAALSVQLASRRAKARAVLPGFLVGITVLMTLIIGRAWELTTLSTLLYVLVALGLGMAQVVLALQQEQQEGGADR